MRLAVIEPVTIGSSPRDVATHRKRLRAEPRAYYEGRVDVGLWIPTTAIFVLLAPFAILLTPLLYLAHRDMRPDPFRTVITLGTLLLALSGTVLEVDSPDTRVRLRFF